MAYKSLNGLTPDYLSSKFVDRSSVFSYSLKDTEGKLAIPQPHTNYMKNSFSYAGAVLGIIYQSNCGRLTPLERSGLAASVSFQVNLQFYTRHSCKAVFYFVILYYSYMY